MSGVENSTYVGGLNQLNPESQDFISQGDDHLKLIKKCLLNTFPGFSRPIDGALFPWSQTPGAITVYAKFLEQTGRIGALEYFVSPSHPDGAILRANNNLSDVADSATARANLGTPAATDVLFKSQNLADLPDKAAARLNLGVTAAADMLSKTQNLLDLQDVAIARQNLDVFGKAETFQKNLNLSDVVNAAAARTNLGAAAQADVLLKAQNLADVPNKATARYNLDVPSNSDLVTAISNALIALSAVTSVNGTIGDVVLDAADVGAAGLDGNGKVLESQIPRYNYANLAAFPATGTEGAIYIAEASNRLYRWNGTAYADVTGLADLANSADPAKGAALVGFLQAGTGAVGRTAQSKMRDVVALKDFGAVGDGVTDDTAALAAVATNQVILASGGWDTYAVTDTSKKGSLKEAKLMKNGAIELPNIVPAYFGNTCSAHYYGGQLRRLAQKLGDPFCQSVNVAFIGDSITWGVGATGSATSNPRDGTLSDPRDYYKTGSYVNLVKKAIKAMLGNGTSEALSNHAASPSGESVVTYTKTINIYPNGSDFTLSTVGTASDTHVTDANALCNSRRVISVVPSASATLKFRFTGEGFDLVFGVTNTGAKYEVLVNGVKLGGTAYSTRTGDDGYTSGYSRVRSHSFGRVVDALIEIRTIHYDDVSGTSALSLEAIRVNKTVRVKNQGISGATSVSYKTYNFPTAREGGMNFKRAGTIAGWVETPTGTTSKAERDAPNAERSWQTIYGYVSGSKWEIDFTVAAAKPILTIAYSSLPACGDVEIVVGGVVISRFSTNSAAPGNSVGYARRHSVTLPAGTTAVKLRTVYAEYGGATGYTNYLYLEAIANYAESDISYPTTNAFGDGVALETSDDFCFIQLGTNDRIASSSYIESPQNLVTNMERILDLCPTETRAVMMVANPAQVDGSPTYHTGMRDVANVLKVLAARRAVDFIDNFSIFNEVPFYAFTTDGLHPNDVGHKLIAANIVAAINNA